MAPEGRMPQERMVPDPADRMQEDRREDLPRVQQDRGRARVRVSAVRIRVSAEAARHRLREDHRAHSRAEMAAARAQRRRECPLQRAVLSLPDPAQETALLPRTRTTTRIVTAAVTAAVHRDARARTETKNTIVLTPMTAFRPDAARRIRTEPARSTNRNRYRLSRNRSRRSLFRTASL